MKICIVIQNGMVQEVYTEMGGIGLEYEIIGNDGADSDCVVQ